MHLAFDSKIKHFEPIEKIPDLMHKDLSTQPENYENVHLDEKSIPQPKLITSIKKNNEFHTLQEMNLKIFESNLINKIEREKKSIAKPMSKTTST